MQTNVDQRLKKLEEGMSTVIRLEKGGKATETIKEEDPKYLVGTTTFYIFSELS